MITSYIIILALSAWLIAFVMLHGARRIYSIVGSEDTPSAGLAALTSAVLFLVVIAAPAPMLVGVIAVALAQWGAQRATLPKLAQWGIPLLAAFFSVDPAHLPAIAHVPPMLVQGALFLVLYAITFSGRALPQPFMPGSLALLACLVPAFAAPLFSDVPSYIALDAGPIAASLLGAFMAAPAHATMGIARTPFALLTGWLVLQPAMHGAYVFSAASLLIYGGAIAYGLTQRSVDWRHAS